MTSQNPLREGGHKWFFYLNEGECVRGKRLIPSNLNQFGMFDQLRFMQIYDKTCTFLGQ